MSKLEDKEFSPDVQRTVEGLVAMIDGVRLDSSLDDDVRAAKIAEYEAQIDEARGGVKAVHNGGLAERR
jgi:hypothetical protein